MKKFRLNLNELKVESFETDALKEEKGTVKGQCDANSTKPYTDTPNCTYLPNHTCHNTCPHCPVISMDGTCYDSCLDYCTEGSCKWC